MKFFIVITWFAVLATQALAQQTTLQGLVQDMEKNSAVAAASVNIKSADGKVVAFKTTNSEGRFQIAINRPLEGLILEVNHLGYKKHIQAIKNADPITIKLASSTILLEDIEIKSRPTMRRMGDTLAYNVDAFAQEEDRSIGDVIRRMPGMEVSESGQIKYQGKAISNFLIDGDDLLEDKYAIGNRTIPHNMVKDIHVLENHEQMKVMKGKRYSDDVAVNLIIKEDAKLKLTGQAKIGAGIPHQYDSEVNTILFNKKVKTLNALSGNNTGKNFSNELTGFNEDNNLAKMGRSPINNLLSLGTVGAPPVQQEHYYFNNAAYLNSNYLVNGRKDWQYKMNLQALYDQHTREFAGNTTYLTEQGSISFDENQESEVKKFLSSIRLSAIKNSDRKFVRNDFSLDYANERGAADIWSNQAYFDIRQRHQIWGLTNNFQYAPELKNKDIVQFNWFINYAEKPQELRVAPGLYPDLLYSSDDYQATKQKVSVPQFYTQVSSGYRLTKGRIKQYYQARFSLENQHLQSQIDLIANGTTTPPLADSISNDMQWLRSMTSVTAQYEWKSNRFQSRLALPIAYQITQFRDPTYATNERRNQILFNPSLQATYRANREDEVSLNYSFGNHFGNIENVYRGIVLKNYRSLSNNDSEIYENRSHQIGANYKLSRALKLMTANWGISYVRREMNTIASQVVTNDITQTVLLPMQNQTNSLTLNAGVDKFIFAWASTLKFGINWQRSDYNQLFNGSILNFENRNLEIYPSVETKLWKGINLSYTGRGSWLSTRQKGDLQQLDRNVFQSNQRVGFPVTISKAIHCRFSAVHLYTHQPQMEDINYLFFDAFARYRLRQKKIDFELNVTNIANIRHFETFNVTSNLMTHNQYHLRGRMAILKVIFNL